MLSVITYFTGGVKYSVPESLALTYVMGIARILVFAYLLSMYFGVDFNSLTAILAVLYADFRFYLDFSHYMELLDASENDEESDETE